MFTIIIILVAPPMKSSSFSSTFNLEEVGKEKKKINMNKEKKKHINKLSNKH